MIKVSFGCKGQKPTAKGIYMFEKFMVRTSDMSGSRSSNAVMGISPSLLCSPLWLFHSQSGPSLMVAKMVPSSSKIPVTKRPWWKENTSFPRVLAKVPWLNFTGPAWVMCPSFDQSLWLGWLRKVPEFRTYSSKWCESVPQYWVAQKMLRCYGRLTKMAE